MQTLLTTIVTWLSLNFALPGVHDQPRIEFVSPEQMRASLHQAGERGHSASLRVGMPDRAPEVEAFYDDATRTIYLPAGWTGETPAEVSVLVHETVHHIQNVAGLRYACPEEREKAAYTAQSAWLALSDRTLADTFGLDPMTVLVRTNCMH